MFLKEIFGRVRGLREARGWSTHELGQIAGMHQPTIYRIENNLVTSIERLDEYIENLAKAFGMSEGDFVGVNNNLNHLPKEVQEFVLDPSNIKALQKLFYEVQLKRLNSQNSESETL